MLAARSSFVLRRSLATSARASFHITALLRTPPTPSQPERSAQTAAPPASFKLQDAIAKLGASVESAKQHLPDSVKQYDFKRPSRGAMWGGAAALVVLGGVYFLSGDDGSKDPILGRPNPADRAYLSRQPTSKLISGWM
jgi:hypothetical protein